MKNIEIDEELYQYIVKNTEKIGESASSILRRLLKLSATDKISDAKNVVEQASKAPLVTKNAEVATVATGDLVFNYVNKEELAMQRGAVGRFLLILAALYRVHPEQFDVVHDIRGRDRLYFATDEQDLAESGSSTKPRQIPESPYWVVTNSNTTRKKMILTEVAVALGYSAEHAEQIRDYL